MAAKIGAKAEGIELLDMAVNPSSGRVYFAVRKQDDKRYLILTLSAGGEIGLLDLDHVTYSRIVLPKKESAISRVTDVTYRPKFGLVRGSRYRATFRIEQPSGNARELTSDYVVPTALSKPVTFVETVYPSGNEVPANLLKFYIHFSQPMRAGREVFWHLHLLDDKGQPIDAPWRETELWSADARRLTLWIHPGRIKQGVALREDFGPVLRSGRKYVLLIDAEMRDAQGQPLGKPFRKEFRTTHELRERVNLRDWRLTSPSANSRQPLAIQFARPLDRHLASRCLHVCDTDLEDLAGNSVERVFDDDTSDARAEISELFLTLKWKPK